MNHHHKYVSSPSELCASQSHFRPIVTVCELAHSHHRNSTLFKLIPTISLFFSSSNSSFELQLSTRIYDFTFGRSFVDIEVSLAVDAYNLFPTKTSQCLAITPKDISARPTTINPLGGAASAAIGPLRAVATFPTCRHHLVALRGSCRSSNNNSSKRPLRQRRHSKLLKLQQCLTVSDQKMAQGNGMQPRREPKTCKVSQMSA